jgi:molecular chaperone DnaK
MNEVKEALKGGDSGAIRTASEKLNEVWQGVSTELYKAAAEKARASQAATGQQPGGAPPDAGAKKDEGPIIDAEVVDDKNK